MIDIDYLVENSETGSDEAWFTFGYDPELTVEDWLKLLKDTNIFTPDNLALMQRMLECGNQATCKELSLKYGEDYQVYNNRSWMLGRKIAEETGCKTYRHVHPESAEPHWWAILYEGKVIYVDGNKYFLFKLRKELLMALRQIDFQECMSKASMLKPANTRNSFGKCIMDINHLHQIFDNYIAKFEEINNPVNREYYKWQIIEKYQMLFDIEAKDFAGMLSAMNKLTENLLGGMMQPLGALVDYAKNHGEEETVREMFRNLYTDMDCSLTEQKKKIACFVEKSEVLRRKYAPKKYYFENNESNAMTYLWLMDPERHYQYRATAAKKFATAVGFLHELGTNKDINIEAYYKLCDAVIDEIRKYPALMNLDRSSFPKDEGEMHPDKNLHILVFDIMFCCNAYGLYDNLKIKTFSAKEKVLYQQRKEKAFELDSKYKKLEERCRLLDEGKKLLEETLHEGMRVKHKRFGEGLIIKLTDTQMDVDFADKGVKTLQIYVASASESLAFNDSRLDGFAEKYGAVLKEARALKQRLENLGKELDEYKTYLD